MNHSVPLTLRSPRTMVVLFLTCALIIQSPGVSRAEPPSKIEFNRDIRPILSDKCFVCHGPDSAKRKAGLRLDQRDAAIAIRDGSRAITAGKASESEVYRRAISTDADLQMPPPASRLKLSAEEIELLRRWIDDGAEYQPHWAFIAPKHSVPPKTRQSDGLRSPIDAFVRARLDREGLTASPEADKTTLIRRVSFDLIGLPPTPADVDDFLADMSPDAFEKLVDRLLASPRYGERMSTNWLDAARYADTNGYQTDGPRFMWRWRDWVIDAFNKNQPFDEFTLDQLAGDLMSETAELKNQSRTTGSAFPSIADARMIATGFNRNHRGNAEGGIIPEEFRVEYVVDRVETTGTVWLGLTIGCARCHDHKYDPIQQREFYQLFAFFNQVPEPGKYIRNDNSMPYLPAPTPDQQRTLKELERDRDRARLEWESISESVQDHIAAMAAKIREGSHSVDWSAAEGLESAWSFDGNVGVASSWKGNEPAFDAGIFGEAARFDGKRWIEADGVADFGEDEPFAISCWVKPTSSEAGTIIAKMDHDNASRGYELRREANGRLQALFSGRILDDLIRVETKIALPVNEWSHVLVTYDGSSAARGVAIRINGALAEYRVIIDLLSNPIRVKRPISIGAGGSAPPFVGLIDEVRCYRGRLTEAVAMSLAAGETISQIAHRLPQQKLSPTQMEKLREYYMSQHATEAERRTRQNLLDAGNQYRTYLAMVPTTMVMQDAEQKRETYLLKRGEYDKPGDVIQASIPNLFGGSVPARDSAGNGKQLDRLDLAKWIVSRDNPLTARVTVNRFWQSLFGVGLVKTAEDFGTQGESPSHPELLDWLSIEFAGNSPSRPTPNWDIKSLLRRVVASSTYRQSSRMSDELVARDPDNRWLARGPRFRLSAEMIRDAALSASGLLVESVGGKSVKPYQPPGLWEELSADTVPGPFSIYVQDHGSNLYRRSVYTFRRRTIPPPALAIFDASPREACRVSLPRTNTPLQALNLMNDVTYLEASRTLAEAAMKEGGASAPSRLAWAFRRILSRAPDDRELQLLTDGFHRRWRAYQQNPRDAEQIVKMGERAFDEALTKDELAAYTASVSVIFNLDEFVSKP